MRKVQKYKIGPSATPIFQYVPFFNLFTMFGHVTSSNMTPYVNHFFSNSQTLFCDLSGNVYFIYDYINSECEKNYF